MYFAASDSSGFELWESNGTVVELVKDINPTGSSIPLSLTELNDAFYFIADDGVHGWELWKSDGTDGGTSMVKDINISGDAGITRGSTNLDGVLYFQADNGTSGIELWKSDGTESGTMPITDIDDPIYFTNLTKINDILYFTTNSNSTGNELWKTNGTIAGMSLVKDIYYGDRASTLGSMTSINGTLYFTSNSNKLWKSDGTDSGTSMIQSIDIFGSSISNITNVNGLVYFITPGEFGTVNLWKSDGSSIGTMPIFDSKSLNMTYMNGLTSIDSTVYFSGDAMGGIELWKSDGTASGTTIVKDINPNPYDSSYPYNLLNVDGVLYFIANDGMHGFELWKSNGTEKGTVMVKDINPFYLGSSPANLVNVGGTLYFTATDAANDIELWKSDGTPAGTVMVENINTSGSSSPANLINVNGTLYCTANDGVSGVELWKNDGTTTEKVKDINTSGDSYPTDLINVNGTLYFTAYNNDNGLELWKSDGSDAGTVLVMDINVSDNSSSPTNLVNVNGTLYFIANDGVNGARLWKTDSTGTSMVENATNMADVSNLVNVGGKLFFIANATIDGFKYGTELWSLGICTTDNNLANAYEKTSKFNSTKQAIPSNTTCHCDVSNNLVAAIDSTNSRSFSSQVQVKQWIERTPIDGFVRRHYEIIPAIDPSIATGKVTFYFTQADFDAYNISRSANVLKLPASSDDTVSTENIIIQKFNGRSDEDTGLPSTYTSDYSDFKPDSADIVWNSTVNRWEISFVTTGFGGYFIKTEAPTKPTGVSVDLTNICNGTSVSLTATCAQGTITCYNQSTGGSAIGTGSPLSETPIAITTYYAACEVGEISSGKVATDEVTVKPIPSSPTLVSTNKTNICTGESVSLTATCATGTIQWYTQATGSTAIGTGSPLVYTPASTTQYYAICLSNGCESCREDYIVVVVNPIPANPTTIALGNTAICSGIAVSLTATCITGTITWYNQATGVSAIGTGNGLSQSPTVSTTYYASCKSSFCESGRVAINQVFL